MILWLFLQRWTFSYHTIQQWHSWVFTQRSWKFIVNNEDLGLPGGSDNKESPCSAGDPGSMPGSGRSSGEGHGNPLQYSCLENAMGRGAWWAIICGAPKSQTWLSNNKSTKQQQIKVSRLKKKKPVVESHNRILFSAKKKLAIKKRCRRNLNGYC